MSIHVGFMVASLIAALAGTMVRDKDIKLILWPTAYGLMSAAMLIRP